MRHLPALLLSLLVWTCAEAPETAQAPEASAEMQLPPGSAYEGPAFEFEEVVPGIFHARGTGALNVGSHGAVVVNDDHVLLVESHISPAAARAAHDEVMELTGRPLRYVVNTHFHFDHAHGNSAYPDDVHVIGHEFTREMIENGGSMGRSWDNFVGGVPDQIAELQDQIMRTDIEDERLELEDQLASLENYYASQDGLDPESPNTTLSERMTLFAGDREIRILFFGRGHTGGDVVVHLPGEGVLITGDLLLPRLPFMGDGYPAEWAETLEHLKGLEFDWVLPGHGDPFQDRSRIDHLQAYLRDFQERATALHAQGLSYQEAAAQIDLTDHAENYPQITGPGVAEIAMRRMFELLEGTAG